MIPTVTKQTMHHNMNQHERTTIIGDILSSAGCVRIIYTPAVKPRPSWVSKGETAASPYLLRAHAKAGYSSPYHTEDHQFRARRLKYPSD